MQNVVTRKNFVKNVVTQKSPSTEFLLEGDLPPWDFKRLATMKYNWKMLRNGA